MDDVTSSDPSPAPMERDEIRQLYRRLMEGWNQGDAGAFAACFAIDGALVGFDGTRFNGQAEIVAFHQPLFSTHLKGTRLCGEITDIRFLHPGIAVCHAFGGTIMAGKSVPSASRDSVQTIVVQRQAAGWCIVAFQNTRVRPMGRHLGGTLVWLFSDWLWRWCGPRRAQGSSGPGYLPAQ